MLSPPEVSLKTELMESALFLWDLPKPSRIIGGALHRRKHGGAQVGMRSVLENFRGGQ